MKKSELRMMIREVVREEVKMELRRFLKEAKLSSKKKPIKQTVVATRKPVSKATAKSYSSNPVLNEVLTETAQNAEYETMGGEPYTTDNMNSVLQNSYSDIMNGGGSNIADATVASMGANPNAVPDHVKDALTKDYSSFMKTVKKADSNRRP